LLNKDMNGRLGDFGLARMHNHGTVGYMFGILILEVLCGRTSDERFG